MSKYITIGMDLGNKKHTVCALGQDGEVLWRRDVENSPEALTPFFKENAGATVAMETGLCCRWISALAKSCGCEVLVGNARKLAAIWKSKQKNDEKDALLIAELARTSTLLFHPVELRDDERHEMVQVIELRVVAVSQRTQAVNSVRGLYKAHGVFIKKYDASCFHKVAGRPFPQAWRGSSSRCSGTSRRSSPPSSATTPCWRSTHGRISRRRSSSCRRSPASGR